MIRNCVLCDCTEANNKCKECKYAEECDFPWVAELWKQNSEFLTPLMPGWVKPEFTNGKMITTGTGESWCIFNASKRKGTVTIQDICVGEKSRGKGASREILNYLMTTYDQDIIAKCVKGSSAEDFWSHLGTKIGEEPSKKRDVCVYLVKNPNKRIKKVDLF